MELDQTKTAIAFMLIVAIGLAGTYPMMPQDVVFMMVLPSMVVFGLLMLAIGVKHGEYRAKSS